MYYSMRGAEGRACDRLPRGRARGGGDLRQRPAQLVRYFSDALLSCCVIVLPPRLAAAVQLYLPDYLLRCSSTSPP